MRCPRSLADSGVLMIALLLPLALALAVAVSPALAADAAKDKPAARLKKNQPWVTPDWEARAIRSIAIAPVHSLERDPEAEAITRRGLERALAGKPYRFRSTGTVHDAVHRARADGPWAAAVGAAMKSAPLDTTTARVLRQALSSDAVFFTRVSNWQRSIVDEQTRGASFTQVGVDVTLYSLDDGAVVWRGIFLEKGDGPYNEPSSSDNYERDPSGHSGRRAALDPPPYAEVVEKLMTRLATLLPKLPAAASAPSAPGKS